MMVGSIRFITNGPQRLYTSLLLQRKLWYEQRIIIMIIVIIIIIIIDRVSAADATCCDRHAATQKRWETLTWCK